MAQNASWLVSNCLAASGSINGEMAVNGAKVPTGRVSVNVYQTSDSSIEIHYLSYKVCTLPLI